MLSLCLNSTPPAYCGWIQKVMKSYSDPEITVFKILMYCAFIPEKIPGQVFSVTDWTEFQYPVKYYITATLKQIGLGYMVPMSREEKLLTLIIMLAGLYLYGWKLNGIISSIVMSNEAEQMEREKHLKIFQSFCLLEGMPPQDYEEMKLSAALMWSSHDIFRSTKILEKFCITESNKLMVETVQRTLNRKLRLFNNLSWDIQLMFAYQFSGIMMYFPLNLLVECIF